MHFIFCNDGIYYILLRDNNYLKSVFQKTFFVFYYSKNCTKFVSGNMHSLFVAIATLVKGNLDEKCLINILMNISSKALRDYLECVKIYKGAPSKKKTDLVEIIVYGHIDKINKIGVEDISKKEANQILRQNKILVKSLPGFGNIGLKKK